MFLKAPTPLFEQKPPRATMLGALRLAMLASAVAAPGLVRAAKTGHWASVVVLEIGLIAAMVLLDLLVPAARLRPFSFFREFWFTDAPFLSTVGLLALTSYWITLWDGRWQLVLAFFSICLLMSLGYIAVVVRAVLKRELTGTLTPALERGEP